MYTVILERRVVFAHLVDEARDEASHADRLDVELDELAELLRYGFGGLAEGKRLGRVEVEEDGDEDDGEDHVELMLRIDAVGVVFSFEGEREHFGGKVDVGNISDAEGRLVSRLFRSRMLLPLTRA